MSRDIQKCREEQERCKEELLNPKLTEVEKYGTRLGLSDWFYEEILIEHE